jgi:hypothetical protein
MRKRGAATHETNHQYGLPAIAKAKIVAGHNAAIINSQL